MSGPEDFNPPPLPEENETPENKAEEVSTPEKEPILKENVVNLLKEKGPEDSEATELLDKYTEQIWKQNVIKGADFALLESLREKAHVLRQADYFTQAIKVMKEVAEVAFERGDTESRAEASEIIHRLKSYLPPEEKQAKKKEEMTLEESGEPVSREEVIEAYKKLVGKIDFPISLDLDDPEAKEAETLWERWNVQQQAAVEGDDNARIKYEIDLCMLYIDAGFHNPEDMRDTLGFLNETATGIPKGEAGIDVKNYITKARRKIYSLLKA